MSRTVLNLTLVLTLAALLGFAAYAGSGGESQENSDCLMCGMDSSKSNAHVKYGAEHFDSFGCWLQRAEEKELNPVDAKIIDFPTFGTKNVKFLGIGTANFVAMKKMQGSMRPYFAGFSSKDAALKAAEENESKVVGYKDVVAAVHEWWGVDGESGGGHGGHAGGGQVKGEGGCGGCC